MGLLLSCPSQSLLLLAPDLSKHEQSSCDKVSFSAMPAHKLQSAVFLMCAIHDCAHPCPATLTA